MKKTAAEIAAELAKDKVFQAAKEIRDEKFLRLKNLYAADEKELVDELTRAGFSVKSVWDFVNTKSNYLGAAPILIKHLEIKHHPKILAGIARSLAMRELSNNDKLWALLTDLYKRTDSDSKIDIPEERGAQQAIAVALESLAIKSRAESLKKLIQETPNGDGIHWLQNRLQKLESKGQRP
jgi:hypothetical protein